MNKQCKLNIAALTCLFGSTNALAFIDVEASTGQRSQKVVYDTSTQTGQTKTATGSEINACLMFNLVPMVPFSFGLTFQSSSVNTGKVEEAILNDAVSANGGTGYYDVSASGKTNTVLYGPMVKVWAPIPFVKPYLKYAYLTGGGTDTIDATLQTNASSPVTASFATKGSSKFSHTGTDLDIGIDFMPTHFVGLFVEYGIHSGKSKTTDQSIDSVSITSSGTNTSSSTKADLTDDQKKAVKADATSIRVGLNVGF